MIIFYSIRLFQKQDLKTKAKNEELWSIHFLKYYLTRNFLIINLEKKIIQKQFLQKKICIFVYVYFFQTEYFQDDLFPDTRVTWEPALTADQWLAGQNTKPRTISLRPVGMKLREWLKAVTLQYETLTYLRGNKFQQAFLPTYVRPKLFDETKIGRHSEVKLAKFEILLSR